MAAVFPNGLKAATVPQWTKMAGVYPTPGLIAGPII
jgi:hypothetical protein